VTRGGLLKTSRHRLWIAGLTCIAIAIAVVWRFYAPRPKHVLDERAVAAAQDEVYAAVVRDMITPGDGPGHVTQLVFGAELLSDSRAGIDREACKEEVRKREHWKFDDAPFYDTLIDKAYRLLTLGWAKGSGVNETVEDFLEKTCSTGHLSRTFQTDLPRGFVTTENLHFEDWPIGKNGPLSFEKLFPGASGVIAFSRVGFDSGMDEAMVSVGFYCGGLCGTGWRYILKKRHGKWEVADKPIVWMS
jgi:hypothetical protein